MHLTHLTDYKTALQSRLLELKKQNPNYNFQNLSLQCGIQKTYLSRVLNGDKAELNSDQFFMALDYLGFTNEEKRYLTCLHEWQRAAIPKRKSSLETQLNQIRKELDESEHHVPAPPMEINSSTLADYYLNPDTQLVHMFLSVERFAKSHELIRKALGVSKTEFSQILKRLLQLRIVVLKKGRYLVEQGQMHLGWDSPLLRPYRTLLRLKSLNRIEQTENRPYSYSVIFTAGPKEREIIQKEFVAFLKKFDEIVRKAPSKEVYQMNFDLFDWSQ